jgi:hypothetical protein
MAQYTGDTATRSTSAASPSTPTIRTAAPSTLQPTLGTPSTPTPRAGTVTARSTLIGIPSTPTPRAATTSTRSPADGLLIPGDFRSLDVEIRDTDGGLVTNAKYVLVRGSFVSGAPVVGGKATLPLLQTSYQSFMVVVDDPIADLTWYEGETQTPVNPIQDDTATIVVEPVDVGGLYAGSGVDFGGMLG